MKKLLIIGFLCFMMSVQLVQADVVSANKDALEQTNKKIKKLIQSQLEQWISGLPNYIKAYLPISLCES
uniref:Uncharacterized protein n=1 Tax=Anaerobacillus isosaccharinicus TaxID=1532552 RepID=A0A1S2LHW7_9BACI